MEMDLSVEATVHLDVFPNKEEVREILRSHGFVLTDLSSNQVRVKGLYSDLKAAKVSLESLLSSKTNTDVPKFSSGAISKHYTTNNSPSGGEKPPHASPSLPVPSSYWESANNHPSPPKGRAATIPDQRHSVRPGKEYLVFDEDVFMYADELMGRDIKHILDSHKVRMEVHKSDETVSVTLRGEKARSAAGNLQGFMENLRSSLRTQEVPLSHMDQQGHSLLRRIQKDKTMYMSVQIRVMEDKLHLVGPSASSYELKQRLLGRPLDRTGRTKVRNSRPRSSSVPRNSARNSRDGRTATMPSPAGHSLSKEDKQETAEPRWGEAAGSHPGAASRRRSQSESRRAEQVHLAGTENKPQPPKSPNKVMQFINFHPKRKS